MKQNKKGQMEAKEFVMTLIVAGLFSVIGLLIFANVSNQTDTQFDPTKITISNESVTIAVVGGSNSTLLAESGYIGNSEVVRNTSSPFGQLVRGTDYSVSSSATSGSLANRGNMTLLNIALYNNTAVHVSYDHNIQSAAQSSVDVINNSVLDSFSLGVISLIVLAAVLILAVLFRLGT